MARLHHPSPLRTLAVVAVLATSTVLGASGSAGAAASPADQAAAQAGLVVASDLGAGWTQTPYHRSDSATAEVEAIPACRRVVKTARLFRGDRPDRAKAHSPRFTKDDTKIDNSTSVLASEQLATKAVAVFSSSGFRRCMTRLADHALAKEKQKDPKFTSVLAHTSISVVPQTLSLPADEEAGLAVTITLTTKTGLTFDERVAFDVARVRAGPRELQHPVRAQLGGSSPELGLHAVARTAADRAPGGRAGGVGRS